MFRLSQSQFVRSLLLRRAARRYASCLGSALLRGYGAGEYYTAAQVLAAATKLGLPLRYINVGFAAFLTEDDFRRAASAGSDYKLLQALFRRYAKVGQPPFAPAQENSYAVGGSDGSYYGPSHHG